MTSRHLRKVNVQFLSEEIGNHVFWEKSRGHMVGLSDIIKYYPWFNKYYQNLLSLFTNFSPHRKQLGNKPSQHYIIEKQYVEKRDIV